MALAAVSACDDTPDVSRPSIGGSTTSASVADSFAGLRRPWVHPPVPSGAACPVATEVGQPDPGLGPLLGTGPARPAGIGTGAVLEYEAPTQGTWTDRAWGGQKVLWAVDPTVDGPVLVRGRQLDGPGRLAFEDPAQTELLLHTNSYEGQPGGWRDYPSFTRIKAPGCYVYQVDTDAGTWSIVFTARGPSCRTVRVFSSRVAVGKPVRVMAV